MSKHKLSWFPISISFVLMLMVFSVASAKAATSELFMSEYIEGTSFNKAIEIYNGTGAPVDLTAGVYTLELYSNGSPTPSSSLALTGIIADGDVYVLSHGSADAAIQAVADVINSSVINFNGDDAVVLRKSGAVVDAFGQIGTDPGSQWPGGGQNDSLRRKIDVCAGDSNAADAFDASVEWDVFAVDTFVGLGAHTANCGGGISSPVINEFVFNHTGSDTEAFIEIFGSASTDYSAFTVLEIEGDSSGAGTIDAVLPVGTTDASGYWTDDEDAENGTVTLLLVEGFSGSIGDDLDTDNDGTLDSTPWVQVVDDVAVHDGGSSDHTYASTRLDPTYDGGVFTVGGASRIPNGVDSDSVNDWVRNDFHGFGFPGFVGTQEIGEAVNTPGAVNEVITKIVDPFGSCDDPATLIHDIQGAGLASTDTGNIRAVEAVVVGVFQGPDQIGGYFVQEEDSDADGDPLTSEGLRVFDNANTPAMGDLVRIRGTVVEFFGLTELNSVTDFATCGAAVATPAAVMLPVASVNDFEAYEGMAVTLPQNLTITEYFNFDRFGMFVLGTDRLFQPTAIFDPGSPEAAALADLNARSQITVDDGRSVQNPDPAIHPNGFEFDLANLFRGGDLVQNVTGVMDYGFGQYRVQPTSGADYTPVNLRPEQPEPVGGDFTVASFNVLNYFSTLDDSGAICGPAEDQGCRGADNAEEFTRQRDKIIAALSVLDADVVGLIEIENHVDDAAVQDLVNGLNDANGAGSWDYVHTGPIGIDVIKVALIYKPATTSLLGDFAILDSSVDPRFDDTLNRPALAQSFIDNDTGGVLTVVVNHLKSKGAACDAVGDPDLGDGAGNCNLTRQLAAEAMVDWLATDPTGSNDTDSIIVGDLNSYDKESPIDAFTDGGFTDLAAIFGGEFAYGYVFGAQLGYLDYALASPGLFSQTTGSTVWHINADEPDLIDYDTSFKQDAQDAIYAPDAYRSSDHDPVISGFELLHYDFTGFFRPIRNVPEVNKAKAGSSVPVKFSLDGDYGLDIFAAGYPLSQEIDCDSGLPGDIEETMNAGGSSLSYEADSDQYNYVWKTSKEWKGTCRQLLVQLNDGSMHFANFQFK